MVASKSPRTPRHASGVADPFVFNTGTTHEAPVNPRTSAGLRDSSQAAWIPARAQEAGVELVGFRQYP
jgi:hypothetical protein